MCGMCIFMLIFNSNLDNQLLYTKGVNVRNSNLINKSNRKKRLIK